MHRCKKQRSRQTQPIKLIHLRDLIEKETSCANANYSSVATDTTNNNPNKKVSHAKIEEEN
jgi:hypothetical protein